MKRKKQQGQRKLPLQSIAFTCTILAAALAGAWFLFPKEMQTVVKQLPEPIRPDLPGSVLPQSQQEQQATEIAEDVPKDAVTHQKEEKEQTEPAASASEEESSPEQQAAADKTEAETVPPVQSCAVAAGRLNNFFSALDKKKYIQAFQLKQPVRQRFEVLEKKLAAKTPTVVRETDDLYTVLANTAHFFRVLGKDNLHLAKAVLEQEQGDAEELAAGLYSTAVSEQCPADAVRVPFNTAYEYAVFFLNTIGGRSYLFRRAAKVRLLTTYYALLIVDEANKKNLNAHGLDISGLIPPLVSEIEANNQLVRKEEYLARLHELAKQYPVR
jgi:hypothetical protein